MKSARFNKEKFFEVFNILVGTGNIRNGKGFRVTEKRLTDTVSIWTEKRFVRWISVVGLPSSMCVEIPAAAAFAASGVTICKNFVSLDPPSFASMVLSCNGECGASLGAQPLGAETRHAIEGTG